MRRIISILALATIVGVVFFWFYTSVEQESGSIPGAITAIPQSAALLLETEDGADLWRDISQTNLIWDELRATDLFFRLDETGHHLDSLLRKNSEFRAYLSEKPVAISVHMAGAKNFDFILSLQLHRETDPKDLEEGFIALLQPNEVPQRRVYDGVEMVTMGVRFSERPIHFFVRDRLLVMSFSSLLLEESARALTQSASILSNPSFLEVRKTRGSGARGQLYVNYAQLKTILSGFAAEYYQNMGFFTQPYARWSALDLDIKANALHLNGFVSSDDSSDAWLSAFHELDAPEPELLEYMPANTAYFAFFGYGSYHQYRKRQLELIEKANRKYNLDKQKKRYDDLCSCDMEALATGWIKDQAAAFITEPSSEEYSQNRFALFVSRDGEDAIADLLDLGKQIEAEGKGAVEEIAFGDQLIYHLPLGEFYGDVVGEGFSGLDSPYITRLNDVIIMGNSANAVRNLIGAVDMKRTLASDPSFLELREHLFDDSNFILYSALARSPEIYSHILNDSYAEAISKQEEVLRKFQAFIYQVSHFKEDLYYNNVYFRHNPEYKQETNSLWEVPLRASVSQSPIFLRNHYTDALETLIQDDSNRVYLVANTGKILWERTLDGSIQGEVFQVDVYKNNKLQILLNTPSQVYLIDRNGNDVENFPIRLPAEASNGVSVADYDNSRDYRFFIGLQDGSIRCYDRSGSEVKGWKYDGGDGVLVTPLEHIRIKKKDYLFAIDSRDHIRLLNRRGKPRHRVETQVTEWIPGGYMLDLGGSISSSAIFYVDSSGFAVRIGFDDRLDKTPISTEAPVDYVFTEADEIECGVLTSNGWALYNFDGDRMAELKLNSTDGSTLQLHKLKGEIYFSVCLPQKNEVHLFDRNGNEVHGFPLFGSSAPIIGDMNRDGYYNLITAGKDGFLYGYAIDLTD